MTPPDELLFDLHGCLSQTVLDSIPSVVALRRDLHTHPELGFQELRTQSVVLGQLARLGIPARPIARTGVVASIDGKQPGRTLLLRADMDALPVQEDSEREYRSVSSGVMHACGHDAHTAMLLGVARVMAARGLERGRLVFLFQPAEEGLGGAQACLDDGLLDLFSVDAAVACHVWAPFSIGEIAVLDGPVMASVDGFEIEILGKGVHAATPEFGIDPVIVACQLVTAAQGLVTRLVSPHEPAVLSFTAVQAGEAFNVIPQRAVVRGTLRTYDNEVRSRLRRGVESLASSLAATFGAQAAYRSIVEHGSVRNDVDLAEAIRESAQEIVGPSNVTRPRPLMVGEDFGLILERIPGAMILLGCGNPQAGATYPHHHSRFDLDERVLPLGVELMSRFAQSYLG